MTDQTSFATFYRTEYRTDHQAPANVALHMAGTAGGLVLLAVAAFGIISPWWAIAFPIVHAGPGLIGHRLFERNEAVGDARLTRTDFPLHWFVAANHLLLFDTLRGKRVT